MKLLSLVPEPYQTGIRIGAPIAAVLAIVAALGCLYLAGRHAGVKAEAPKVEAAQRQAATATAPRGVTTPAAAAADAASTKAVRITVTAEEAAHAVQQAPGASDALPPELLARWRAGIDGVRASSAADAPGADRSEPAGAVPPAGG